MVMLPNLSFRVSLNISNGCCRTGAAILSAKVACAEVTPRARLDVVGVLVGPGGARTLAFLVGGAAAAGARCRTREAIDEGRFRQRLQATNVSVQAATVDP